MPTVCLSGHTLCYSTDARMDGRQKRRTLSGRSTTTMRLRPGRGRCKEPMASDTSSRHWRRRVMPASSSLPNHPVWRQIGCIRMRFPKAHLAVPAVFLGEIPNQRSFQRPVPFSLARCCCRCLLFQASGGSRLSWHAVTLSEPKCAGGFPPLVQGAKPNEQRNLNGPRITGGGGKGTFSRFSFANPTGTRC